MSDVRVVQLGKLMGVRWQRIERWRIELQALQITAAEREASMRAADERMSLVQVDLAGLAQWATDHLSEAGRWAEAMNARRDVLRHRLADARVALTEAESSLQAAREASQLLAGRLMQARSRYEGLAEKRQALAKEADVRDETRLQDEASSVRPGGRPVSLAQRSRNA